MQTSPETRATSAPARSSIEPNMAVDAALHSDQSVELQQALIHLTQLVHRPSVTPNDAGCQQYISRILQQLGFSIESFEKQGVSNLIAKIGNGPIRVAFSGHTDVVPAPYPENWSSDPFTLDIDGEKITGRGVADMKGGIAAMLAAVEMVVTHLDFEQFTFYFLITSDEEGEAEFGTQEIIEKLEDRNELPHLCIVGEPSSQSQVGDVLKIGRRGSLSGEITIFGQQGHVAYPTSANNAAHKAMTLGSWLSSLSWDEGTKDFPGTHLQITGINTGEWTDNIIPGRCTLQFNVRYSHKVTQEQIIKRINDGLMQLKQLTSDINVVWSRPCIPYLTSVEIDDSQYIGDDVDSHIQSFDLIIEAEKAIFSEISIFPRLSVSGGTSDGRFIANKGAQVIELGLPNHSIHKINEHIHKNDLFHLTKIYKRLLLNLMTK
ncbi:succinyl-diaminopimelate desuccinylase [Psychrosphaera aestuarii]|uniref:succinyl-diaminopimelate desuccinylase n=1 Tax=Psychrosphaera aestuarii TaxID=1266052 RepID=UPI001FD50362|nr:succinyl-diaminopimelate desuccinylase [Psychrosphaera aestuarii]